MLARSEVAIRNLYSEIFIREKQRQEKVPEKASDYSHGAAIISTEAVHAILQIKAVYVHIRGPN